MNSSIKSLGADWANVLFGLWVIVSPFALGFSHNVAVRWNNIAVGIAVVLMALVAGRGSRLARGLLVLLGGWLLISPFILGFMRTIISWNNLILGLLILIGTVLAAAMRPMEISTMAPPH